MKLRSLINDKKGQIEGGFSVFGIFTFMIVAFVCILFFAGLIYIQGLLHTSFDAIGVQNEVHAGQAGYTNMSAASDTIWGTLDDSIQSLHMVAAVYILALAACMIITNALVKLNPVWYFGYVLMSILAVIFSVPISNAYQNLLSASPGVFGGELANFTVSNWIMINLPIFVFIVSILGGIFLFVGLIRNNDQGETLR